MFALGASVDRIATLGMKNIEERALELNRFLTSRLIDSGWRVLSPIADERMRSAETLVEVDDPAAVVAKLAERKVIVTKKPQGIRVATHFFNNEEDVERLIAALASNG
jgi:selenocysteine lyase/cysteine desulfurase